MVCQVPGDTLNIYRWTKGDRTILNVSRDGVLNLTIFSADDFGLYTCEVINSEGNAIYNITICQKTSLKEKVTQGITDYRKKQFSLTCFNSQLPRRS